MTSDGRIFANRLGIAVTVFFLIVLGFPPSSAAQESVGRLKEAEGPVSVERPSPPPGRVITVKAGTEEELFIGDLVKTGLGGKARLVLKDETVITLAEEAEMEVREAIFEPAAGRRSTTVRVLQGMARAVIPPIPNQRESSFTFETPTAVVGVRGSEGVANAESGEKTTMFCLEDTWGAKNIDPDVKGDEPCPPNHFTEIWKGKPPTKAALIPAALLLQIQGATTLGGAAGGTGAGAVALGAGALGLAAGGTLAIIEATNDDDGGQNPATEGCSTSGPNPVQIDSLSGTLNVWDHASPDDDQVDVSLNGSPIPEFTNLSLLSGPPGTSKNDVVFNGGENTVLIHADNEGSQSPNTVAIQIIGYDVSSTQKFCLTTGQEVSITVTFPVLIE